MSAGLLRPAASTSPVVVEAAWWQRRQDRLVAREAACARPARRRRTRRPDRLRRHRLGESLVVDSASTRSRKSRASTDRHGEAAGDAGRRLPVPASATPLGEYQHAANYLAPNTCGGLDSLASKREHQRHAVEQRDGDGDLHGKGDTSLLSDNGTPPFIREGGDQYLPKARLLAVPRQGHRRRAQRPGLYPRSATTRCCPARRHERAANAAASASVRDKSAATHAAEGHLPHALMAARRPAQPGRGSATTDYRWMKKSTGRSTASPHSLRDEVVWPITEEGANGEVRDLVLVSGDDGIAGLQRQPPAPPATRRFAHRREQRLFIFYGATTAPCSACCPPTLGLRIPGRREEPLPQRRRRDRRRHRHHGQHQRRWSSSACPPAPALGNIVYGGIARRGHHHPAGAGGHHRPARRGGSRRPVRRHWWQHLRRPTATARRASIEERLRASAPACSPKAVLLPHWSRGRPGSTRSSAQRLDNRQGEGERSPASRAKPACPPLDRTDGRPVRLRLCPPPGRDQRLGQGRQVIAAGHPDLGNAFLDLRQGRGGGDRRRGAGACWKRFEFRRPRDRGPGEQPASTATANRAATRARTSSTVELDGAALRPRRAPSRDLGRELAEYAILRGGARYPQARPTSPRTGDRVRAGQPQPHRLLKAEYRPTRYAQKVGLIIELFLDGQGPASPRACRSDRQSPRATARSTCRPGPPRCAGPSPSAGGHRPAPDAPARPPTGWTFWMEMLLVTRIDAHRGDGDEGRQPRRRRGAADEVREAPSLQHPASTRRHRREIAEGPRGHHHFYDTLFRPEDKACRARSARDPWRLHPAGRGSSIPMRSTALAGCMKPTCC